MEHQGSCTGEVFEPEQVFPEAGSVVKFKNFERCVESPFVIDADFESCLEPMYEDRGERTTSENQHIPIGYSYYLVSRVDPQDNKLEHYTARFQGEDVVLHFLRSLRDTVLDLFMKYRFSREMRLSCSEEQSFKNSMHCWVCGKQFTLIDQVAHNDPPVRDHCHYTGRYRGAAHNSCNLRIRRTRTILVLFHDFTNYDNHLFVRSLGKIEGDINVIARNDEKHISVTKEICVSKKSKWKLRFSDTSSFMLGSLASHVSNLRSIGVENFKIYEKVFPRREKV